MKIVARPDPELKELIEPYLKDKQKDLETIERALKSGLLDPVVNIGHQIKGIAANFGFPELGEMGAQMETAALANDTKTVKRLHGEMKDYLSRVEVIYD